MKWWRASVLFYIDWFHSNIKLKQFENVTIVGNISRDITSVIHYRCLTLLVPPVRDNSPRHGISIVTICHDMSLKISSSVSWQWTTPQVESSLVANYKNHYKSPFLYSTTTVEGQISELCTDYRTECICGLTNLPLVNMFAISQMTFSNAFSRMNFLYFDWISLRCVSKGLIDNKSTLVQIMAWRRTGGKPFPEPVVLAQFTDAYLRLWDELSGNSTRMHPFNHK